MLSRFLRLVDFGSGAEVDFAGVHEGFAQRGMRMDRFGYVSNFTTHLDRQNSFGDQLAGTRADDAATEDLMCLRVDQPLGEAFGTTDGLSTTAGGPRIRFDVDGSTFALGLIFSQTRPSNFWIGKDDGWIARLSNVTFFPRITSTATLAS